MEHILLIDDNSDSREVFKELLEVEGYSVLEATNGQQGMDILRSHHQQICLIILDWIMPIMDGHQFLQNRETFAEYRDIPVLLFSGHNKIPDAQLFTNVRGQIPKPVDIQMLLEMIEVNCIDRD